MTIRKKHIFSTQSSSRWLLKKGYLTFIALSAVVLTSNVIFLETTTRGIFLRGGTTSNLKIEDAATDLINATDTARRSNATWISRGATHSATAQCLSLNFEDQMDAVISNSTQVFITMPAKAAGTSLKQFTKKCMKQKTRDNFINYPHHPKNFLTDTFELPSIITSHLYSDQPLVDLAQQGTRQTLMIYMHRDETERLLSGIRQVLTSICAQGKNKDVIVEGNQTHCILSEGAVVKFIENRYNEIGGGSPEILTCAAYEAIEQNAPNMIVVHYEQANKLQKLLAKHHCPELLEELPTKANVSKEKSLAVYLRLQKGGEDVVNLDEWLHKKSAVLEWSLKLKKHASCQAKTRHMEDDLFACSDQTIKVSSTNIKCW
jgi:hypothetical protein